MQIVQLDPSIMDIIDHDEAIRMRANLLGVPKSVLRGREEVDEMREAKAQQAAMEQQMMQQQQMAEMAQKQAGIASEMAKPETREIIEEATQIAEEEDVVQ